MERLIGGRAGAINRSGAARTLRAHKQLTRPVTHNSSTRQQRFQYASDEANNPLLKAKRERDSLWGRIRLAAADTKAGGACTHYSYCCPGFIVDRFVETLLTVAANLRRRSFVDAALLRQKSFKPAPLLRQPSLAAAAVLRQNIVEACGERR